MASSVNVMRCRNGVECLGAPGPIQIASPSPPSFSHHHPYRSDNGEHRSVHAGEHAPARGYKPIIHRPI